MAGHTHFEEHTEEYLEAILEIEEEGVIPIRARLVELGHPARAGTDVQNPGDAAD